MENKKFWIGIVFLCLLFFAIVLNFPQTAAQEQKEEIKLEASPHPTPIPDYRIQLFKTLNKEVYSQLPEMPLDFKAVRAKYYMGQLPTERVTEKYWKQPEFYPNWESEGMKRYAIPKEQDYMPAGYGSFPSEYIALTNPNDVFEVSFYALSDYTSMLYWGIRIEPDYPNEALMKSNFYLDNTRNVTQDSNYLKEHLRILSITPQEFILEPARNYQTYEWNAEGEMIKAIPISYRFESNWVKKIIIRFQTVNLKTGKYAVTFSFMPPSEDFALAASSKYLTRYKDAGSDISVGWQFGVFLDVQ